MLKLRFWPNFSSGWCDPGPGAEIFSVKWQPGLGEEEILSSLHLSRPSLNSSPPCCEAVLLMIITRKIAKYRHHLDIAVFAADCRLLRRSEQIRAQWHLALPRLTSPTQQQTEQASTGAGRPLSHDGMLGQMFWSWWWRHWQEHEWEVYWVQTWLICRSVCLVTDKW